MYNLANFHIFQIENPRLLKYELDVIPYRASQLWQQVPIDIREAIPLPLFKILIKTWQKRNYYLYINNASIICDNCRNSNVSSSFLKRCLKSVHIDFTILFLDQSSLLIMKYNSKVILKLIHSFISQIIFVTYLKSISQSTMTNLSKVNNLKTLLLTHAEINTACCTS